MYAVASAEDETHKGVLSLSLWVTWYPKESWLTFLVARWAKNMCTSALCVSREAAWANAADSCSMAHASGLHSFLSSGMSDVTTCNLLTEASPSVGTSLEHNARHPLSIVSEHASHTHACTTAVQVKQCICS